MPLAHRARGRLTWLLPIMVLSVVAASVIYFFEDTLKDMIVLAMFLPVVAGLSGSSGGQAVALSLRELALGVVKPWDVLYVLFKELKVGVVNGLVMGVSLGLVAAWVGHLWGDKEHMGLIVGAALMINTVLSVCLGGTLPLLLKRVGIDPATAAGPILTTVVDTGGFSLVLSLAWLAG